VSAVSASSTAAGSAPADPVRALQHGLYRAAKADSGRRFHALRAKVYRRDVLERAWAAVRRNNGAPGIDATTLADVEKYGVARLLDELATPYYARAATVPCRRVGCTFRSRARGNDGRCPSQRFGIASCRRR
jgi:RNA-directed DNA polymerase